MNKVWEITVEEDPNNPDECILPFPEEFLKEVGWKEGDTLEWDLQPDGSIIISKVND